MTSYYTKPGTTGSTGTTGTTGTTTASNPFAGTPAGDVPAVVSTQGPDTAQSPEQELTTLQLEQLKQEAEWNQMMRPILLKQMGLIEEKGADGKMTLRPMTEEEKISGMTDEEKANYEIERDYAARQAKAAKGELDVPGYVKDELGQQRTIQENLLSQRLGAKGAKLSTSGINTKATMLGNESLVKNAYSYGQESQGSGLLGAYNSYLGNQAGRNTSVYGNFSNAGLGILPMAQTASQPYSFGRQLQDQNEMIGDQRRTAASQGGAAVAGTLLSMYLTRGSSSGGSK